MSGGTGKIVIIGAGPCGLGAAWRLQELGYDNYQVFEKNDHPGGLSASFVDGDGFTWDIGGHVHFSHYGYFDRLLEDLIPQDGWLEHERESWIWMRQRFIPYPFQNNIGRLPEREMMECLAGLLQCRADGAVGRPENFREWIEGSFGEGIAKHFLIPYNKKVWAYAPEQLNASWIGERVAVPDVDRIMANIIAGRDDRSWGPNNTFTFPLQGGTGAIWQALASRLPAQKIHYGATLTSWDSRRKIVRFADGREESYDYLISTMPLDQLLDSATDLPAGSGQGFVHSCSHIVGVGLRGEPPGQLRTKCWMYFPEDDNPFYRVTVFSNYSYKNVPSGKYWSLMGEVSESPHKPVDRAGLREEAVRGFRNTGLIENEADIVTTWLHSAEYAYPTPFLKRDELLGRHLPELESRGVYSRGRFGAWKYECANQDHVVMQGVEAVERILFGTPEITVHYPAFVNTNRIR